MSSKYELSLDFRSLDATRPLYFLPRNPFHQEVIIPAFKKSFRVDCMVGFFSSSSLSTIAPGLAAYINNTDGSFNLIMSPFLSEKDHEAIKIGAKPLSEIANDRLETLLITEDMIAQHTLKCLSYLIQKNRIIIKIALMKKGIFHPKVWIFENNGDYLAAHGSSNMTESGFLNNFEQITVSKSWVDPNQRYTVEQLRFQFNELWEKNDENCEIIELPKAIKDKILKTYNSENPPTEAEFEKLYKKAFKKETDVDDEIIILKRKKPEFVIPNWLEYENGPYAHQGKAVNEWCASGYKGILEMATGSGKTITSMISAYNLFKKKQPLLIIISAPYIPLINQWCDEVSEFGIDPVNLSLAKNARERSKLIDKAARRLKNGISAVEAAVITHDSLCSQEIFEKLSKISVNRLIIADEVHNLGRPSFVNNIPEYYEYRLGLSATPIRQYDEEGTEALINFFGPIVYRFPLEEAIGNCLVEYDYFVHPCYLTNAEMDDWYYFSDLIRQNAWRKENKKPDEYLSKLLRDRRRLLEVAEKKIQVLNELVKNEDRMNLKHTLIYTSDKDPDQILQVNEILNRERILFHQLTYEETSDRKKTKNILNSFQNGELQVITAKRVLDEGVNVPQICRAFILASTTVERQWVQRRGRLLRTCKEIGKTHSIIHDFLSLPPLKDGELDDDARKLIKSELTRIMEFAKLARNAGRPDGPFAVIDQLINIAFG